MADLFIELLVEDIPARMQVAALADFERLLVGKLTEAGLKPAATRALSSPRRLAVECSGLPVRQADLKQERRGPRIDGPEAALQGFLRANGLDSVDALEQRETDKGKFWFAVVEKAGEATSAILPALIAAAITALPWPKSMRWRDTRLNFVRPLRGIIALFDGAVLEGGLSLGLNREGGALEGYAASGEGPAFLRYGAATSGHRFLAPASFTVTGMDDYRTKLEAAFVLLGAPERRQRIEAEATALAKAEELSLVDDQGLLDEVTGLVEWPVPLIGRIGPEFMGLPPEVLTTSMRTHQKYFALRSADGSLAPRFILVSNMRTTDQGKAIVAGNERVLRARLSDAKFFWDQDRKVPLNHFAERLEARVFHKQLGTVSARVERLEALAAYIAHELTVDVKQAERAARLAKADLSCGMVGEFPELQGVMGRYYALEQGEDPAVADAIADHYRPLGPSDECPTAPLSVVLALADKLDLLAGFFSIGERPSGSKDPFALRRAALGVIRLIRENQLALGLEHLFTVATGLYRNLPAKDRLAALKPLVAFFADRLKVTLREAGLPHDQIQAVANTGEDDICRLVRRVQGLNKLLADPAGLDLLAGYRRASNILRIEEKKDERLHGEPVDARRLVEPAERDLHGALEQIAGLLKQQVALYNFDAAMGELAALRDPVDRFFTDVTVNAEDPALRENRLRLLNAIRSTFQTVADFSAIEG